VVVILTAMAHHDSTTEAKFDELRDVRNRALEHARMARQLSAERRKLIEALIAAGHSQAEIARELGVTRQAVQKMLGV
jgi:DNA-binding NarL/FixJ family response regulator